MKPSLIRRALAVPAALLLVSLFAAASARAQAPVDDSKTVVKSNKITDNFYTVDGRGGTIGVLVGPQGTFMVDTQFAPLTDRIVAEIKKISPNPIQALWSTRTCIPITPAATRTWARWARRFSRATNCAIG